MARGLQIKEEQNGHIRILHLQGSVDDQTYSTLEGELDALLFSHHKTVLLDFSQVSSLTDEGLNALVSTAKKFKLHNGALGFSNLSKEQARAIDEKGFSKILLLYRDAADALQAMPEP